MRPLFNFRPTSELPSVRPHITEQRAAPSDEDHVARPQTPVALSRAQRGRPSGTGTLNWRIIPVCSERGSTSFPARRAKNSQGYAAAVESSTNTKSLLSGARSFSAFGSNIRSACASAGQANRSTSPGSQRRIRRGRSTAVTKRSGSDYRIPPLGKRSGRLCALLRMIGRISITRPAPPTVSSWLDSNPKS